MADQRHAISQRIQTRLEGLTIEMDAIVYGLDRLFDDIIATQNGWKCHIAIDFHQLYCHAFPAESIIQQYDQSAMQERDIQSAVYAFEKNQCVFALNEIYGWPVVLPPYMSELRNAIVWRSAIPSRDAALIKASEMTRDLESRSLGNDAELTRIVGGKGQEREITPYIVRRASRFLLRHISKVALLTLARSPRGFKSLADLFKPDTVPRVLTVGEQWPEYSQSVADVASLDVRTTDIYKNFKDVRGRWDADYVDALAVQLIRVINQILRQQGRREYLALFSDARAMFSALNWDLSSYLKLPACAAWPGTGRERGVFSLEMRDGPLEMRVLRNSEGFLLHRVLTNRTDDWPSLDEVRKERTRLTGYMLLKNSLNLYVDEDGRLDLTRAPLSRLQEIEASVDKYRQYLTDLKEVRLTKSLEPKLAAQARESVCKDVNTYEEQVVQLAAVIEHDPHYFFRMVEKRESDIGKAMRVVEAEIRKSVLKEPGQLTRLGEGIILYNILPFGVTFHTSAISELIATVTPSRLKKNPERVNANIRKLLQIVDPQRCDDEHTLLLAVLLMMFGEHGTAVYVLVRRPSLTTPSHEFNRKYLLALAWHQKSRLRESEYCRLRARTYLDELQRESPDSSRVNYLAGLMWVHWADARLVDLSEGLKTSIDYSSRALENSHAEEHSARLELNIHNNLVWAKCEFNSAHGADPPYTAAELLEHLRRMEEHQDEWLPAHFDTAIVVYEYLSSWTNDSVEASKFRTRCENYAAELETVVQSIGMLPTDELEIRERISHYCSKKPTPGEFQGK